MDALGSFLIVQNVKLGKSAAFLASFFHMVK